MKRVLAILLVLSFIVVSLPAMAAGPGRGPELSKKVEFSDISAHWAKNVIAKMADSGVIRGVGNGKFLPDVQMKRSEFAVALHKAAGIIMRYVKAPDINEFYTDVKNEDWFASPLYDLAVLNIVDDRGEFRPDDLITREEMVHYLINAYNYKLGTALEELDNKDSKFSDDKKIEPKFKKAVKKAVKLGFIRGRGNNKFVPKGITTRAEAIVVLERLMENLKKIADEDVVERPQLPVKDVAVVEPVFVKDNDVYKMKIKITNNSDKEVVINHTSGQKYDFILLDNKKEAVYKWSDGRFFTMALIDTTIAAGETVEFTEDLDLETYEAISDKVFYFKALIVGSSENFEILEDGYYLTLKEAVSEKADSLSVVPGYEKGTETFKMKLSIKNTSDKEVTINYTSGQKFDFKLLDADKEIIYTWSADKLFMMMMSDAVIGAGETVEYVEELDMESFKDTVEKAKYLKAYITGTSEDVKIEAEGYEVEIK